MALIEPSLWADDAYRQYNPLANICIRNTDPQTSTFNQQGSSRSPSDQDARQDAARRPKMVDVTSISGLSKIVNLRQYKMGGAAHIAEERKVKEDSKLWDIEELAFLRR
jgi:hypothetical protein